MERTRDYFSPDPRFYALAEAVAAKAKESAERAKKGDLEGAAGAWKAVRDGCQGCHLRYGGPAGPTSQGAGGAGL